MRRQAQIVTARVRLNVSAGSHDAEYDFAGTRFGERDGGGAVVPHESHGGWSQLGSRTGTQ